ncbi:MAG TPA: hypothetical protein DD405_02415 [Desulfobacteraceae bacterium]|nr:hypothetical protein [Desulfobacteraceae bacterium]
MVKTVHTFLIFSLMFFLFLFPAKSPAKNTRAKLTQYQLKNILKTNRIINNYNLRNEDEIT